MDIKVSLFASSVRPQLYESFFKSLAETTVPFEVIFAGNNKEGIKVSFENEGLKDLDKPCEGLNFGFIRSVKYIQTENIKPAQCYEIARRHCQGECVIWVADDCEFRGDIIGKAYRYWKSKNNEKLILSIQTKESGYNLPIGKFFNMKHHSFHGFRPETPLMAPLGFMSRAYLEKLGGIDRRYVCGQYENDIVMRALADGGEVEIFGDQEAYIDIDHLGKSLLIGESKKEQDFLNRPFARGYHKDREVLEASWTRNRAVVLDRNDQFEPYEDKDLLIVSQSNKGIWE